MRKPRFKYEIEYSEHGRNRMALRHADSQEEAVDIFHEDHPGAEIINIDESWNEPEYEHF